MLENYTDRQLLEELLRRNSGNKSLSAHVEISDRDHPVHGYSDYYANFAFDERGGLIGVKVYNVWENNK
jgi:hypothetical protein